MTLLAGEAGRADSFCLGLLLRRRQVEETVQGPAGSLGRHFDALRSDVLDRVVARDLVDAVVGTAGRKPGQTCTMSCHDV